MELSPKLKNLYDSYYNNDQKETLKLKRDLTALQSVRNLRKILPKSKFKNLLDIGAGDGNTLVVLANENIAEEFGAIEISTSGLEEIKKKNINNLVKVELFDGYDIKEPSQQYELGVVLHVLEHVEHERLFINEATRVCKITYIEVPLENTFFIGSAVKLSPLYGHINFYNPHTLKAMMTNLNLDIIGFSVFSHSIEYEMLISGKFKGWFRFIIKKIALKLFPKYATFFFTYTGGIVISKKIS
jgi:ubiquinone/menaquinone biosynthesis C-methylase UbiE